MELLRSCLEVSKFKKLFLPARQDFLIAFPFLGPGYTTTTLAWAYSKRRWLVLDRTPVVHWPTHKSVSLIACTIYVRESKGKGFTQPHAISSLTVA